MREIRFRTWIDAECAGEDKGLMITYENDYDCRMISNGNGFALLGPNDEWIDKKHYKVMQYTGLNDKNGTDIYEGDILRGKFASGHGGKSTRYKEFNVQVKYSESEFTITFHGDYNYRFYPQWDECEVIGNVYQDPELLEN